MRMILPLLVFLAWWFLALRQANVRSNEEDVYFTEHHCWPTIEASWAEHSFNRMLGFADNDPDILDCKSVASEEKK